MKEGRTREFPESGDRLMITNIDGLSRIAAHLRQVADADMRPLMEEYARIMVEDNERLRAAGLSCDEARLPPTVRERTPRMSQRLGGGPPLTPRNAASRARTYFKPIDFGRDALGWYARCGWRGFDSRDGRSILAMHKQGGPYPVRDLISHVSPTCKARARVATRAFVMNLVRYKG